MKDEIEPLDIKMILLGDSGVGKTSIIGRYVDDSFSNDEASSSSMTYIQKKIKINNQKINLSIWDTVGQEKYRSLTKLFFKDTKIVILVYAINKKDTFDGLTYWLNLYKDSIGDEAILGVAGNKSDLFLKQEVDEEEARKFAEDNKALFSLISAKENKPELDDYINKLVQNYLKKYGLISEEKKTIKLNENDNDNIEEVKAGCCAGSKGKRKVQKYSSIIKEENGIIHAVFLGDDSVGKTSIINQINKKGFNSDESHTSELNEFNYKFHQKKMRLNIIIHDVDNEKKSKMEFIDILKKSKIFFLVYDVKNKESRENLNYWIEGVNKIKDNINKNLIYVLANKHDKNEINNEAISAGKSLALENKFLFKAISAKDNEGIIGLVDESVQSYLAIP
jgi:small GTP-binding protein